MARMASAAAQVLLLLSCSSAPAPAPAPAPAAPRPAEARPRTDAACIVAREDAEEIALEGMLRPGTEGAPFVLRLAAPRCVVGMARGSVLTEVVVISDGFDLRSVVDRRVRLRGRVIGDATDLEGPALVFVARTVEDLPRSEGP